MHLAASTFLLVFSLVGCSTLIPRHAEYPASAKWKEGDFHVHFQAGPRGRERSYSFYEIKHSIAGQQEQTLVMESAHSVGGFASVTNRDPKNWIRIVEDPNGKALLIEEDIPNDCGPCSNYLWVRMDSNGFIEGMYLRLPSKTFGDHAFGDHGGINYEYPRVRSLKGGVLTFGYSSGPVISKRINSIEKADRPMPPG